MGTSATVRGPLATILHVLLLVKNPLPCPPPSLLIPNPHPTTIFHALCSGGWCGCDTHTWQRRNLTRDPWKYGKNVFMCNTTKAETDDMFGFHFACVNDYKVKQVAGGEEGVHLTYMDDFKAKQVAGVDFCEIIWPGLQMQDTDTSKCGVPTTPARLPLQSR